MNTLDKDRIQKLTSVLFKEALRLTHNKQDYAWDLVQEVWCKILTRDDLDKEKLNEGYLIKMLRNHYYDRKKLKMPVNEFFEGIEVPDENETEAQMITKMEGDETEKLLNAVWNYLDGHDNGWILKKQAQGYKLNELAKTNGIDYKNLRKIKSRLLLEIRQKFKGRVMIFIHYFEGEKEKFCHKIGRFSLV